MGKQLIFIGEISTPEGMVIPEELQNLATEPTMLVFEGRATYDIRHVVVRSTTCRTTAKELADTVLAGLAKVGAVCKQYTVLVGLLTPTD